MLNSFDLSLVFINFHMWPWLKLRYSWYGQMSPGQILPGQMSSWQLASVKNGPKNQILKFGQNQVSQVGNSRDIPDMDKCCKEKYCLDK